jgi:hypothetical protein
MALSSTSWASHKLLSRLWVLGNLCRRNCVSLGRFDVFFVAHAIPLAAQYPRNSPNAIPMPQSIAVRMSVPQKHVDEGLPEKHDEKQQPEKEHRQSETQSDLQVSDQIRLRVPTAVAPLTAPIHRRHHSLTTLRFPPRTTRYPQKPRKIQMIATIHMSFSY